MPKKQVLTVAELKNLLLARFNAEDVKKLKLQERLQQELGLKCGTSSEAEHDKREAAVAVAIKNQLVEWICDALARRLKQNWRTTALLSRREFIKFVPSMIDEISKIKGEEISAEGRKLFTEYMEKMCGSIFETVRATVPPRKNPYDEYWRWVTTVLGLAAERGVLPTELLAVEDATDEITRRMFNKKQFIALSKRTMNKFMDADVLKKIVFLPVLEALVAQIDIDEDKQQIRKELEAELEAALMPQMREAVEKRKGGVKAWLDEEVERIYAA